jgi:hypothetical protein
MAIIQSKAAPAVAFITVPVSMRARSETINTAAFAVSQNRISPESRIRDGQSVEIAIIVRCRCQRLFGGIAALQSRSSQKLHLKAEAREALQLLARSPRGGTEDVLELGHGDP